MASHGARMFPHSCETQRSCWSHIAIYCYRFLLPPKTSSLSINHAHIKELVPQGFNPSMSLNWRLHVARSVLFGMHLLASTYTCHSATVSITASWSFHDLAETAKPQPSKFSHFLWDSQGSSLHSFMTPIRRHQKAIPAKAINPPVAHWSVSTTTSTRSPIRPDGRPRHCSGASRVNSSS